MFQALPGSNFTVNGAAPPQNSALTSASAELHLTTNWTAIAKFDGEFAPTAQTYAGTGTLKYSWSVRYGSGTTDFRCPLNVRFSQKRTMRYTVLSDVPGHKRHFALRKIASILAPAHSEQLGENCPPWAVPADVE